jgi:hypothetical protein
VLTIIQQTTTRHRLPLFLLSWICNITQKLGYPVSRHASFAELATEEMLTCNAIQPCICRHRLYAATTFYDRKTTQVSFRLLFLCLLRLCLNCGVLGSWSRLLVFLHWQGPRFLLSGVGLGSCAMPVVHDVTVLVHPGFASKLVVGC